MFGSRRVARRTSWWPGRSPYLGGSGTFDQAIADFAETYADQNERDYSAFQDAVKDGTVEATTEI